MNVNRLVFNMREAHINLTKNSKSITDKFVKKIQKRNTHGKKSVSSVINEIIFRAKMLSLSPNLPKKCGKKTHCW